MQTATQEPQTTSSPTGPGNNDNKNTATAHRQPMGSETASLWLIVIVLLVGAGIWFWVADKDEDTIIPGVSGIQGTITDINVADTNFVLDKKKLIKDNGDFSFEEETYTVHWTDDTTFYTYDKTSSIQSDFTSTTNENALRKDINVIVTPRERAGNVITAVEVRILPGSSRAKIVE